MSTVTAPSAHLSGSRRARAAHTAEAVLRGGLLAAAIAFVAWVLVSALAATAFFVLILATVVVVGWAVWSGKAPLWLWGGLAAAWAVVMLERWAVHDHGGLWVAAASWLGIVYAARRAGMRTPLQPLLLYPLLVAAAIYLAGTDVFNPWGISWLWVAGILGPVSGMRTLFRAPAPDEPAATPRLTV